MIEDRAQSETAKAELGKTEATLVAARRANLEALCELGGNPFETTRYPVNAHAGDLKDRFAHLTAESEPTAEHFTLGGRIMSSRDGGKLIFAEALPTGPGKFKFRCGSMSPASAHSKLSAWSNAGTSSA